MVEEVRSEQWRGLEPEGRGHDLLVEWGRHRKGGERSHSPVTSGSWSEPTDKCHEDEPDSVVAIDRIFFALTRSGHGHSVEIAKQFYLEHPKYDFWQVAEKVNRTVGFVRLTLRGVCAVVEERIAIHG